MIAFAMARFLRHVMLIAAGGAMFLAAVLALYGIRSRLPIRRRLEIALTIAFIGVAVSLYPVANLLLGRPDVQPSKEAWEYAAGVILIFVGLAIALWDLKYPYRRGGKVQKIIKRAYERLKNEPAMVAGAVSAAIAWLATEGFTLTETQEAIVWTVVSLVFGAAVRQLVTPTRKL